MTVSLHKRHITPTGEPAAALSAADNQTIFHAWAMARTALDPYALQRRVRLAHLERRDRQISFGVTR